MSSRSSSRSHEDRRGWAEVHGPEGVKRNDSLVGSTVIRRVRTARAVATLESLTPYETNLIFHLDRVRYATRRQLSRLQPTTTSRLAATRRLQRTLVGLVDRRVLARLDRIPGGRHGGSDGPLYALDVIGQRLVTPPGSPRRPRRPWFVGERFTAHVLAVTEAYVRLHEAAQTGQIELVDFEGEPSCWRTFTGRDGDRSWLKPDAFVHVVQGDWEHLAFLEIDLATESLATIAAKATQYQRAFASGEEQARLALFPSVVWLTSSDRRRAALADTLGRLPAEQWRLHRVGRLEHVVELSTGAPPNAPGVP